MIAHGKRFVHVGQGERILDRSFQDREETASHLLREIKRLQQDEQGPNADDGLVLCEHKVVVCLGLWSDDHVGTRSGGPLEAEGAAASSDYEEVRTQKAVHHLRGSERID